MMVWTALRADDVNGIDYARLLLTSNCLRMVLIRSKTTGPGKRVLEAPLFIHRLACLSGMDWLKIGYDIWKMPALRQERDFFVPDCSPLGTDLGSRIKNRPMPVDKLNAYLQ